MNEKLYMAGGWTEVTGIISTTPIYSTSGGIVGVSITYSVK